MIGRVCYPCSRQTPVVNKEIASAVAGHRGFTRKKFLDAIPLDLLRRYLANQGALTIADGDTIEEAVDRFLQGLDEETRQGIDEEFHCINDIADRGMDYLQRACQAHGVAADPEWTREHVAMYLFLEYPRAFQMAYDFYVWRTAANSMSHHQFSKAKAKFNGARLDALMGAMEAFFQKQAKGERCKMRHYLEGGLHLLLVARGDHLQTQLVWERGEVRTTFFRPAKEDVLQFNPKNSVLSIRTAGRGTAERDQYIDAFGRHVLQKTQLELRLFTNTTVSLEPIRNGSFDYEGNETIRWIKLVEVGMRLRGATDLVMKLRSDDLRATFREDLPGIRLTDGELQFAKLKFMLGNEGSAVHPQTVEIRPPSYTKLNRRRDVAVVEAYLRKQGVLLA